MNIRFSKNWNNKLALEYFTTARLHTESKLGYYLNNVNKDFDVLCGKEKVSMAELVDVIVYAIKDLPQFFCYIDGAMNKEEFYKLMEKFYSKKPEWNGMDTKVIILTFKTKKRFGKK